MSLMILKIGYGLYFLTIVVYILHLISMFLFGKVKIKRRAAKLSKGLILVWLWPLMIFSPGGLKLLLKLINFKE